jgi:hypothetical protein
LKRSAASPARNRIRRTIASARVTVELTTPSRVNERPEHVHLGLVQPDRMALEDRIRVCAASLA